MFDKIPIWCLASHVFLYEFEESLYGYLHYFLLNSRPHIELQLMHTDFAMHYYLFLKTAFNYVSIEI